MRYQIGEKIHGFVVEQSRHIKEIGGDIYIMRHEHSGAQLCYVDNDDRNMTYSVTFATPSQDSTGVFHILEHSVLCGSDKYPVDDPFVELMKSSLYTFLNAMTFPDKTMYPVSSMNEKDLMNLMSVYTDAVFRPLIYDNENAFRQEGWHIEVDGNGKPYYQGVVYNEMKGALGDPDETLYTAVFKEAYQPCQYTTVSGGHPDEIVKLSYEQFINTHKKYYHPSNARFYLYGKLDLEEKLRFLDGEYLADVEAQEAIVEPPVSVKKQNRPYRCTYSVDEEREGEDYYALTFPVCMLPTQEQYLALTVLAAILGETNYDPLKKRILDKGLAVEVECSLITDLCYPLFTVKLQNCDASKAEEIRTEILDCLKELAADGLDKEAVRAKLSSAEFALREGNGAGLTKGLYYNIQIAESWLYNGEPWRYLEYENALEVLKNGVDNGYFENLIQTVLLDNEYKSEVIMTPKAGENRYSEPAEMPDGYQAENRRSDSDPTPHLSLDDIDKKTLPHLTEKRERDGKPYLYHPLKTDGIVYAGLYFDIASADDGDLFYLSLLSNLLTNLGTENYSGERLQTVLGLYTGAMDASHTAYDYDGRVISAVVMRFKAMAEHFGKACELAEEIVTRTKFDDKKGIVDLISQIVTDMQLGLINNSAQTAATRAAANFYVRDAIYDKMRGIGFYTRVKALKQELDGDPDAFESLKANLERVYDKYFVRGKAVLSVACDEETGQKIKDVKLPASALLTDALGEAESALLSGNIAVTAPCDIVFNGFCSPLGDDIKGGELNLCKKILSLEYLWQKIRVENGAYGCGANPGAAKRLDMWSYRDPQIGATLASFGNAAKFLSDLSLSERAIEDYIISCIRSLDTPQMPQAQAHVCNLLYLAGKGDDVLQKERDELLAATLDSVNAAGNKMQESADKKTFCTVGNTENINANAALYDEIIKL